MSKVIKYTIDDLEYYKKTYSLSDEKYKEIFDCMIAFQVIYTLYGDEKSVDRFELTDFDGNKIDINSLNGYQRGVILSDCYNHFIGGKYQFSSDHPCGVIKIENLNEND